MFSHVTEPVGHSRTEDPIGEVHQCRVEREALTLVDGHRVREDQRELLPVHVELFSELSLHLFHLVVVSGMIKFDLHVAGGNVSDRTNGTIHQATLCVKVSLQLDLFPWRRCMYARLRLNSMDTSSTIAASNDETGCA